MRNYRLDGDDLVEIENLVALVLALVRDGLVEANELFPDGDIDAARRRLHELSNAAAGYEPGSGTDDATPGTS
jgi:hypothetical protein